MTAPLKPIPNYKRISTYELASVLESCAKALKDMPLSVIRSVEYEEQEAYLRIENIIKGVNNRLVQLEQALSASEDTVIAATDAHYDRTSKVVYALNEKLKKLPEIDPGYRLPYNAKEIFEVAERYSQLDDATWVKVIELAKAFAPKNIP